MKQRTPAEIEAFRKRIRLATAAAGRRYRQQHPNWKADAKATMDAWMKDKKEEPGLIFKTPEDLMECLRRLRDEDL